MGRYKKHTGASSEMTLAKAAYIDNAERIVNIVTTELDTENYSGMNVQLSEIINSNKERNVYVFAHPGVVFRHLARVPIVVLSVSFLYYLFIGESTYYLSTAPELLIEGLFLIIASAIALLINIALYIRLTSTIRFKSRFDTYEKMLGFRRFEFVEELAISTKQKESLVVKDLRRAIKQKLIPQGHLSNDNRVLMVSDQIYDSYQENSAVYDCYFQNVLEDRQREKSRTKRIAQLMEAGEQYIEKFDEYSTRIKDKRIVRKLANMGAVVTICFHELDATPRQVQSLGIFLNCYMSTTEKLLDAYIGLDKHQVPKKEIKQSRKEIYRALSTVIIGFESILEQFFEEQETEIASDIQAMALSMKP